MSAELVLVRDRFRGRSWLTPEAPAAEGPLLTFVGVRVTAGYVEEFRGEAYGRHGSVQSVAVRRDLVEVREPTLPCPVNLFGEDRPA